MSSGNKPVGVVPLGEVCELTVKSIAAHILGYLHRDALILPPMEHPMYAYNQRRHQYDAGAIITAMESLSFPQCDKIIGVVDLDLFIPIFIHVFGEARQGGRAALVSICRLKPPSSTTKETLNLQMERAAKVALHELGHLYDLHHCMDALCLMHFSGGLEDLDQTPLYLCRYCSLYLRDALSVKKHREKAAEVSS
jgi:archaemetzincin